VQRFPIRRSPWAIPFLAPLSARRPYADVGDGRVVVHMGLLGHAEIPIGRIDRVGTISWPWWAGVGARIARGMVAFVGASGPLVLIELDGPLRVRAPLGWTARTIAIGAEDVDGLIAAIAQARRPPASEAGAEGG
jgi:hypothetical protein